MAVKTKTNVQLISANDFLSKGSWWTVGINCTVLDQRLVSKGAISYKNGRARTKVDGYNWAKFGMEGLEDRL